MHTIVRLLPCTAQLMQCVRPERRNPRATAVAQHARPRVGRKTAERVLMEMKDRLDALNEATVSGAVPMTPASTEGEAWTALVALGYKPAEVARMVRDAAVSGDRAEEIIRKALKAALR